MRLSRGLLTAAIGILAGIGSAGIALAASTPVTARIVAGTGGTATGGGGAQPVPYLVSPATQRAVVAFWTRERMEQAASAGSRAAAAAEPSALPASPGTSAVPASAVPPKGTPTATKFAGIPTVGALFYTTGTQTHFCTASVTDSHPGDLVLTAAHCIYTTRYATNVAYVPQYHDGLSPDGIWPVKAMLVATRWQTAHDPNYDFAFLALATVDGQRIQAVTNGLTLGLNGSYAEAIEVIGYNDSDDQPVHCATRSFEFRYWQQEFYCHDFWMGTSGGPWITGLNATTGTGTVHGVIGGYEEGGNYEWASYSDYFGWRIANLYFAAEKIG